MKTFKKFVESAKVLNEAKLDYGNRFEFDTIGGKPEITIYGDGEIGMGCWSSGAKTFKSEKFKKMQQEAGERGEYYKVQEDLQKFLNNALLKAMEHFDKEMEAALKKYDFKKA